VPAAKSIKVAFEPAGDILRNVVVPVDERRLAEDALDAVRLRGGGAGRERGQGGCENDNGEGSVVVAHPRILARAERSNPSGGQLVAGSGQLAARRGYASADCG
jgi:hypothetical protein